MGWVWVVLAALLFGVGTVAQAAALPTTSGWAGLVRHPAFLLGTAAEALGAVAHVAAVQTTSMAVAQCAISASLAVTALAARWWFGTRLGVRGLVAIGALSVALVVLAAVSGQSGTTTDTVAVEVGLLAAAALVGLAGAAGAAARSGVVLAVCSGLGFAVCSVAVKLVDLTRPLAALTSVPALALVVGGAAAGLWWVLALRHAPVTTVTAVAVVAEVVPPSLLGPLLGDEVSSWFPLVAPLALACAAAACAVLARTGHAPVPVAAEEAPRELVAA